MGWTGRAPAPNGSQNESGAYEYEEHTAMPKTDAVGARTIGIDTSR